MTRQSTSCGILGDGAARYAQAFRAEIRKAVLAERANQLSMLPLLPFWDRIVLRIEIEREVRRRYRTHPKRPGAGSL